MVDESGFVAGALCLDFVNTVGGDRAGAAADTLASYADLVQWAVFAGTLSKRGGERLGIAAGIHPASAARMLGRAKRLREALHGIFHAVAHSRNVAKDALEIVNAEIGNALAHARIAAAGSDFTWGWTGENTLDAPLWAVAGNAGNLLASEKLSRLRECDGDICGWLFLDLTKNRSRRWCDMKGCGNRAKVRRYRASMP